MKRGSLLISCGALLLVLACTANRAYRLAQAAEDEGDWDRAVIHYLELVDQFPKRVAYRTGLLRAKIRASQEHFERGKRFQEANAMQRALAEFQQAVQLDPSNQYAQVELEKLREQLLRADDDPIRIGSLEDLKEKTRGTRPQPPVLNPRSREPISLEFPRAVSVFDIYRALGTAFGINILFDPKLRDQQIAIELRDVVAQDALEILMRTANHFYKVLDEQSIIVVEDSPQNRRNYEDLVIQTFFLSNAEVKDVMTMLRSLVGAKNVASNDQLNAIVLRDTADKVKVAERIIHTNDKARGEVVIDVELLQIGGNKIRELGVRLSENFVVQSFDSGTEGAPNSVRVSDLEFINQGNWFVTIPNITYNFLKNSSDAEILASPQVRISDGEQATLHIGERIPIPVTSFNTSQTVGGNIVPLTSFQYQDIGIRLDMEPRIHHNKEISLELQVEVSNLSGFVEGSGGQNQPIIATRTIESVIRLKNGETNFLAGLIRTDEITTETGVPGLSDIPVLGRLFSNKRTERSRTDLVLTLTPHIIRTPDITEEDLLPIWVGTEANITFRGGSPRVESEVEGPFDEGSAGDAERIREMIRRRIQNLPRGLQDRRNDEAEEQPPTGIDLAPSAAPGDVFGRDRDQSGGDEDDDGGGLADRSLIIVPDGLEIAAPVSDLAMTAPAVDLPVEGSYQEELEPLTQGVRVALFPVVVNPRVGEFFRVEVVAQAADEVAHLPMTISYDPEVLEFDRIAAGDFLGPLDEVELVASSSRPGRIVVGASRLGRGAGVSGSGALATVRFRALRPGETELAFVRVSALSAELQSIEPVERWHALAVVSGRADSEN
ncbi:MAG: secretin N-terminal domain-containing protein [Thermoanaerobaculia bacterium]